MSERDELLIAAMQAMERISSETGADIWREQAAMMRQTSFDDAVKIGFFSDRYLAGL